MKPDINKFFLSNGFEHRQGSGYISLIKTDDFERLCASVQNNADYFECRPIILSDRTGELVIIAGNQRYKAAQEVGLLEVPTILLHGLTEAKEKEIADKSTNPGGGSAGGKEDNRTNAEKIASNLFGNKSEKADIISHYTNGGR